MPTPAPLSTSEANVQLRTAYPEAHRPQAQRNPSIRLHIRAMLAGFWDRQRARTRERRERQQGYYVAGKIRPEAARALDATFETPRTAEARGMFIRKRER